MVVNGTISVPNLSEENDVGEVEVRPATHCQQHIMTCYVQVTATMTSDSTPERQRVFQLIRKEAPAAVRGRLSAWLKVCSVTTQ